MFRGKNPHEEDKEKNQDVESTTGSGNESVSGEEPSLDELLQEIDDAISKIEERGLDTAGKVMKENDEFDIKKAIENNVFPRVVKGKFQKYLNALEGYSRHRARLVNKWEDYLNNPARHIENIVKNKFLEKAGFSENQVNTLVEKLRSLNDEIRLLEEKVEKDKESILKNKEAGNTLGNIIPEGLKEKLGVSSGDEVSDEEYLRVNLEGYRELEELRELREKINDKIREKFEESGFADEIRNRVKELLAKIEEHKKELEDKFSTFMEIAEHTSRDFHPEVRDVVNREVKKVIEKAEKYTGRLRKLQGSVKSLHFIDKEQIDHILEGSSDEVGKIRALIRELVAQGKIKSKEELAPWFGKNRGYYYAMIHSLEPLIPSLEFAFEKRNNGKAKKILESAEHILAKHHVLRRLFKKEWVDELFGEGKKGKLKRRKRGK